MYNIDKPLVRKCNETPVDHMLKAFYYKKIENDLVVFRYDSQEGQHDYN